MAGDATYVDECDDFAACYAQHYQRVVRSLEFTGLDTSEAQDVAQDAFVVTLRNWGRVREGSNPSGYPYRVAFMSLKKRRRTILIEDGSSEPAEPPVDVATQATIADGLSRLPPKRRAVAVMGLVLGFPSKEIGDLLEMSEATARKHLELARRDLQRWVSD